MSIVLTTRTRHVGAKDFYDQQKSKCNRIGNWTHGQRVSCVRAGFANGNYEGRDTVDGAESDVAKSA